MELLIGETIKKYRRERELTQEAFAQIIGVSAQSISKWECGDGYPDITLLPSIANYFEITVDELMGNDKISAEEDIQKNYFSVEWKLGHEERLQLALKYHKKYPRNWHIATSLMHEITRHHRTKLEEYKLFLYTLCERILRECTDSVMRRSAIKSICMICEEEEIDDWLNKDTTFWYKERHDVFTERYRLTGDREQYEMYRCANNFLHISQMLRALNNSRSYRGHPDKAIQWNLAYLRILDTASGYDDTKILPTGWISEYASAYMRLAAAYFGVKNKDLGYESLEKALSLAKQYHAIPDDTPLDLGNSIFYGDTKAIQNDDSILLPNGKKLHNFSGICAFSPCAAEILEASSGWEWFNEVRKEERYLNLLAQAKGIEK